MRIDGSYGEGGGQIVRTAVALSALTGREIRIDNVRAKRGKQGLAAQHLTAVLGVASLCDGEVDDAFVGSTSIGFRPGKVLGGTYELDVGTAGSVTLVLQACMLASVHAPMATELEIKGGTNVRMSPPVDYYAEVLLPMLGRMGLDIEMEVLHRGFYPQGGGAVHVLLSPSPQIRGIELMERGKLEEVGGIAYTQNLPEHVGQRLGHAARKAFLGHDLKLRTERATGHSTGAGLCLHARYQNTVLGGDALGEKGVPAERVGEEAVERLREEMDGPGTLDMHASDQLVAYMALADRPSRFIVQDVSLHLSTQMWLLQQFLPVEFSQQELEDGTLIEVRPNRTSLAERPS